MRNRRAGAGRSGSRTLLWVCLVALSPRTVRADAESSNGFSGFPVVAYLPETGGVLGGYGLYHFRFRGQSEEEPASTLPLLAAITTDKELGFEFTPELFLPRRRYWITVDLTTRWIPDAVFFGFGNQTRTEDEETYRTIELGFDTSLRARVIDRLYVGVTQTLHYRAVQDVAPDRLLARLRPRGIAGGWTSGVGPELVYDTRDNTQAPHRGSYFELSIPLHGPTTGSEWTFGRIELDLRHFFQLHREHILAVRAHAEIIIGDAPFDRMAELAGSSWLRGYVRGRFRDKQSYSLETEYRFPLFWRFGGTVFVGIGQVAPRATALAFDRFHLAGGVGLRFALVPEERINLRLDVAAEPGSVHPYFAPLEAY